MYMNTLQLQLPFCRTVAVTYSFVLIVQRQISLGDVKQQKAYSKLHVSASAIRMSTSSFGSVTSAVPASASPSALTFPDPLISVFDVVVAWVSSSTLMLPSMSTKEKACSAAKPKKIQIQYSDHFLNDTMKTTTSEK